MKTNKVCSRNFIIKNKKMYAIFGKGMVGNSLKSLLDYLKIENKIMDDNDFDEGILEKSSKIIVSPGIPQNHKIYQNGRNKITGEFDICREILKSLDIQKNFEIVGITGTDGKSTTTRIIYNLFKNIIDPKLNTTTHIGGNFEPTFAEILYEILKSKTENSKHILILEISSFMAYNIQETIFDYSVFINFERDHLNRHKDMEDYFESKMNVVRNTRFGAIISDNVQQKISDKNGLNFFSPQINIDISKTKFVGKHNAQNFALSYSLLERYIKDKNLDIPEKTILNNISEISPLPHRTQFIRQIGEIQIYDDGKSTTANSLRAGINSFKNEKIILIAGGSDKGDDFSVLKNDFKNKLDGAILLGQTAPKIAEVLKEQNIPYQIAKTMEEAVNLGFQKAKDSGTKVLLFSPGCASFDMFKNRLDRVGQFLDTVQKL